MDDQLYADIRTRLARCVASVCPAWLSGRRDDLVQSAVTRLIEIEARAANDEGNREYAASYLWKVAYSVLVDEIRRQRRQREVAMADDFPEPPARDDRSDPLRSCEAREISDAIADCLSRIVRPRRLAVTLHLQGHTVPEAAALLGWGEKKTENLVYRGLADLKKCLGSKGVRP